VPRVSIGLPVYNGATLLPRALDSVLAQDFTDFELIISDNASDDATREICSHYARQDPRIRYVRQPTNVGLVANFDRVVDLAAGEFFKWVPHDDWWHPTYLRRCLDELDANPAAVLCSTGVVIVDGAATPIGSWTPEADLTSPNPATRFHRLIWSLGETHAVFGLIRTPALRRTELLQSYLGSDRVMLAELALLGPILQIPAPLHLYTIDPDARRGRRYSEYNDPRNRGRIQLRTPTLCYQHLRAVHAANIGSMQKARLFGDVLVRFGLGELDRTAAEIAHAARSVVSRRRVQPTRARDETAHEIPSPAGDPNP
jgi:glycosyltransferase involved in cell wall biosynthesis